MSLCRLSSLALRLGLALCGVTGMACTPTTDLSEPSEHFGGAGRVRTTQGSAVAVTADRRIAVVCNRTDGIVSIMRLKPSEDVGELLTDKPPTQLEFRPLQDTKPWAAVIGPDDDTAYVLLRNSGVGFGEVRKVVGLHSSNPHETGSAEVGSEPTSIVITPSGKRLFVANSNEGTISAILTQNLSSEPWSFNGRLADSGFLGPSAVDRPALAHPRALAMTDNGDKNDEDELIYATEFFSQPIPGATGDDPDHERQGVVYPFDTGGKPPLVDGKEVPVITLAPVPETGFLDAEGNDTGCFPNQLYGAAVLGERLLVTSVCASPAGPIEPGLKDDPNANNNFKTVSQTVVFAIDTTTQMEVTGERVLMNQQLDQAYLADATTKLLPEPRMPLIPNDIVGVPAFEGGGRDALISAFGASAVFRVHYDASGIGRADPQYVQVGEGLPTGLAVLSSTQALVVDDLGRRLGAIDLVETRARSYRPTIDGSDELARELVSEDVRSGRHLFATGLLSWSFQGAAWTSCESCHPEGYSDGVAWRFVRGPRRSISTAGTYYRDDEERRVLLWTANVDEVHDVEAIARNVSGGAGGVVWNPYSRTHPHKNCRLVYDGSAPSRDATETSCQEQLATDARQNGLNGSLGEIGATEDQAPCSSGDATLDDTTCNVNRSPDWDEIDAYIRSVRAPRAPTLSPDLVAEGRMLFVDRGCVTCHSGPGWTLSKVFYEPGVLANGQVPSKDPRPAGDTAYMPPEPLLVEALGELRLQTYAPPAALLPLNPPAASGSAPFRALPKYPSRSSVLAHVYNRPAGPDQINCVLRAVGTFGKPAAPGFFGVNPGGAPVVHEVRRIVDGTGMAYGDNVAGGATGFNIPSLVGLSAGGPYFHAGNARTLEEVFDPVFSGHHSALGHPEPTPDEIEALVSYLLSIDEYEGEGHEPPEVPDGGVDLCAQFEPARVTTTLSPLFWGPAPDPSSCDATKAGVCQNPMDCLVVISGQLRAKADKCARSCATDVAPCEAACVIGQEMDVDKVAVSAPCADCYLSATVCGLNMCQAQCASGTMADCDACLVASGCVTQFRTCSGL